MKAQRQRTNTLLGSLFSASASRQVPGLIVREGAITAEEEAGLLESVDSCSVTWTRRRTRITKNYGPFYLYKERDTPEGRFRYTDGAVQSTPLPAFLYKSVLPIAKRAIPQLVAFEPNQLHVALYRKEEDGKIRMHNDNKMGELGDYIVGMCLLSDCEMTFVRPRDGRKRVVQLPRGCVYAMTGESHFEWRHGILSGQTAQDRVSFTLREVRKLAVEDGARVTKSRYMPTEDSIEQQRRRDELRKELRRAGSNNVTPTQAFVQPVEHFKLRSLLPA